MTSSAKTPEEYLESLPADRREAVSTVRDAILKALPEGYEETMAYGMITFVVPYRLYPAGYHCDPKQALPFLMIASQKNYMAIYLMCIYASQERSTFRERYEATGKKLDMGASCIRFKKVENLALDVITEQIASSTVEKYVSTYLANLPPSKRPKSAPQS